MSDTAGSVDVEIRAAMEPFRRGLQQAQREARTFDQRASRAMGGVQRTVATMTAGMRRAREAVFSLQGALVGLGAGLILRQVVRVVREFESQMAGVGAVTGATTREMEAMTRQARELGATTVFSASQAAGGMEFLGRAGFETNQIMEATPGTLDLAAAGSLELARAADIASNALQAFGLEADQMGRVSDVMASAAASANTNVEQLAQALSMVGPVSAGVNISLEDTIAAIGTLSNSGIQATRAGTGLRAVLAQLASPSEEVADLMGELTLRGDGLHAVLQRIDEAMGANTDAIALFGRRGGPAFNVLRQGARSTEELSDALREAEGEAKRLAEQRLGSMEKAMRELNSATEELMLSMGEGGLSDAVANVAEQLTEFARSEDAVSFAENLGTAVETAAGGFLLLAENLDKAALAASVLMGMRLGAAFGPIGIAVGGAAAGFATLNSGLFEGESAALQHADALSELQERLREIDGASEDAAQSVRELTAEKLEGARAALQQAEAELQLAQAMVHPSRGVARDRLEEARENYSRLSDELRGVAEQMLRVKMEAQAVDQTRPMIPGEDFALFGHGREDTSTSDSDAGDGGEVDAFQRTMRMIEDRTRAIELEKDTLNASVAAQEAARVEQELMNSARQAEIPLTDTVRDQIDDLSQKYGEATQGLEDMREAQRQAAQAQQFFGDMALNSLSDLIVRGEDASDVMRRLASTIADAALQAALLGQGPLSGLFGTSPSGGDQLGGLLGALFNARGNVFRGGQVQPFARGGVVREPTMFPMASGAGVMGEDGPEAIMPLRRGSDGNLGVQASGTPGGSMSLHMPVYISAPGADPAQLRRLQERVEALRRSAPDIAVAAVKNAQSRRAL